MIEHMARLRTAHLGVHCLRQSQRFQSYFGRRLCPRCGRRNQGPSATLEIRQRRRAFIDELKMHVPVQPVTDESGELAGTISGSQAAKGIKVPADDLLTGVAALEQGYAVAILNRRHFERIPNLIVVSF
jgi:predicted nucleic acid-binding protein